MGRKIQLREAEVKENGREREKERENANCS